MTDFLQRWDELIQRSREVGKPAYLWKDDGDAVRMLARTMHPSFMAAKPPKYDPRRDA